MMSYTRSVGSTFSIMQQCLSFKDTTFSKHLATKIKKQKILQTERKIKCRNNVDEKLKVNVLPMQRCTYEKLKVNVLLMQRCTYVQKSQCFVREKFLGL